MKLNVIIFCLYIVILFCSLGYVIGTGNNIDTNSYITNSYSIKGINTSNTTNNGNSINIFNTANNSTNINNSCFYNDSVIIQPNTRLYNYSTKNIFLKYDYESNSYVSSISSTNHSVRNNCGNAFNIISTSNNCSTYITSADSGSTRNIISNYNATGNISDNNTINNYNTTGKKSDSSTINNYNSTGKNYDSNTVNSNNSTGKNYDSNTVNSNNSTGKSSTSNTVNSNNSTGKSSTSNTVNSNNSTGKSSTSNTVNSNNSTNNSSADSNSNNNVSVSNNFTDNNSSSNNINNSNTTNNNTIYPAKTSAVISTKTPVVRYKTDEGQETVVTSSNYKYGIKKLKHTTSYYYIYSDGSKEVYSSKVHYTYDNSDYSASDSELRDESISTSSNNMSYYNEVLNLVNKIRADNNIAPLSLDENLCKAATMRALEMNYSGYFSHTRPDGRLFSTVFNTFNLSTNNIGENIAYGYNSPSSVVKGWKNSSGHYSNMIDKNFTKLGVGMCSTEVNDEMYWIQLFSD